MTRSNSTVRRRLLGACVLSVLGVAWPAWGEGGRDLKFEQTTASLILSEGGRPILDYRYGGVPFKPYVASLATRDGVQVLRDSPLDHKHHHGLMFALAAERVNFWEETPAAGRQVHRGFSGIRISARDGLNTASFSEQLDWVAPQQGVLLRETRQLTVYPGARAPATLVTWSTRLEPAAGKSEVTLSGSNYFGLGMRFVVSMDKVGEMQWADSRDNQLVQGDTRLTRSAWCAYTAPVEGKPVTAALFDHPRNPRHPARMFSMKTPFAYLSATLDLSKQPMKITKERPLAVRYGVALWDGRIEPSQVDVVYRLWQILE